MPTLTPQCVLSGACLAMFAIAASADPTHDYSYYDPSQFFSNDQDVRYFKLTSDGTTPVALRTYGFAGGTMADGTPIAQGGFDPLLMLWDNGGSLVDPDGLGLLNDDGAGVPTDSITGSALDALFIGVLPVGTYWLGLSQSYNVGKPNPGDGYEWDNLAGNVTAANLTGCSPTDPSLPFYAFGYQDPADLASAPTCYLRSGQWALDVLGVSSSVPVSRAEVIAQFPPTQPPSIPEPGTLALMGLGLAALRRRRPAA